MDQDVRTGSAAVDAAVAALSGRVHRLGTRSTDLRDASAAVAQRADAVLDVVRRRAAGTCVVACIGRTKAGKSTLRYVLTGDGADGIGCGGQRTTRTNIAYDWAGLTMVDTPGVGARHGAADEAVAAQAVAGADLVVWVAGSDSQQPATVLPVLRAVAPGRPVLVVLNHKRSFDADEMAAGLTAEAVFDGVDGHESRIRTVLADAGVTRFDVVHAHLGLAQRAWDAADPSQRELSRVDDVEAALKENAALAMAERAQTRSRLIGHALDELEAAVLSLGSRLEKVEAGHRATAERLGTGFDRAVEIFAAALDRAAATSVSQAMATVEAAADAARRTQHRGDATTAFWDAAERAQVAVRESLVSAAGDASGIAAIALSGSWTGPVPDVGWPAVSTAFGHCALRGNPRTVRALHTARRGAQVASLAFGPVGRVVIGGGGYVAGKLIPTVDDELRDRAESVDGALLDYRRQFERVASDFVHSANGCWRAALAPVTARGDAAAKRAAAAQARAAAIVTDLAEIRRTVAESAG